MTALATLKTSKNAVIRHRLREVFIQEMFHLTLVANILNAVGGKPTLNDPGFIPGYPSALPGGLHPKLIVPIKKFTLSLVKDVFSMIEQPEVEVATSSSFKHIFTFVRKIKDRLGHCQGSEAGVNCELEGNTLTLMNPSGCFISDAEKAQFLKEFKERRFIKLIHREAKKHGLSSTDDLVYHNNTIGGFYRHILQGLGYLTDCGADNSIFTGDESKQVTYDGWTWSGHSMKVADYLSAVDAIKAIVDQGEGSSPCNPEAISEEGKMELSHYYTFLSVIQGHEIKVSPNPHVGEEVNCKYDFTGPEIPFDPNAVWPMVDNANLSMYGNNTKASSAAKKFNRKYTEMLTSLDNVFNGHADQIGATIGLMYTLFTELQELVQIPIDIQGDQYVGPNVGPTYDFTPHD